MSNAFVTLLMGAPHYLYGVIAMVHSLRKTETKYNIVCMITPDFQHYKLLLEIIFDEVVVVPYLKYKTGFLKTKKQNDIYGDWKDVSYTKWQCLSLTKYNKVCLLDADLIIQQNIDHLFDLPTPSGRWGNNWDCVVNYYDNYKHGDIIPDICINKGLERGYLVNGHCVILEPSVMIYQKFIKFMNSGNYRKSYKCLAMVDENALVKFMKQEKKQWTQIAPEYNCIPWKVAPKSAIFGESNETKSQLATVAPKSAIFGEPNEMKLFPVEINPNFEDAIVKNNDTVTIDALILHYFNKQKAWQMTRGEWPDIKIWYDVWDSACETYPIITEKLKKI